MEHIAPYSVGLRRPPVEVVEALRSFDKDLRIIWNRTKWQVWEKLKHLRVWQCVISFTQEPTIDGVLGTLRGIRQSWESFDLLKEEKAEDEAQSKLAVKVQREAYDDIFKNLGRRDYYHGRNP